MGSLLTVMQRLVNGFGGSRGEGIPPAWRVLGRVMERAALNLDFWGHSFQLRLKAESEYSWPHALPLLKPQFLFTGHGSKTVLLGITFSFGVDTGSPRT